MGFSVNRCDDAVVVVIEVSGEDRMMNRRGRLATPLPVVSDARVEERHELEALIDHRSSAIGTRLGRAHPNRRRIGTMLGHGVLDNQFWAVAASDATRALLVIDLLPSSRFRRLVLDVDDPSGMAAVLPIRHTS